MGEGAHVVCDVNECHLGLGHAPKLTPCLDLRASACREGGLSPPEPEAEEGRSRKDPLGVLHVVNPPSAGKPPPSERGKPSRYSPCVKPSCQQKILAGQNAQKHQKNLTDLPAPIAEEGGSLGDPLGVLHVVNPPSAEKPPPLRRGKPSRYSPRANRPPQNERERPPFPIGTAFIVESENAFAGGVELLRQNDDRPKNHRKKQWTSTLPSLR